jgi:hypothetical protein
MRDLKRVIDINRALLPAARADELSRRAAEAAARAAVRRGARFAGTGDVLGAYRQGREAVRASRSPQVLAGTVVLALRVVRALWHRLRARPVPLR